MDCMHANMCMHKLEYIKCLDRADTLQMRNLTDLLNASMQSARTLTHQVTERHRT